MNPGDFLSHYSLTELILIVAALFVVLKQVSEYIDWGKSKRDKMIEKHDKEKEKEEDLLDKIKTEDDRISTLENNQMAIMEILEKLDNKMDGLIQSDMEQIKYTLTQAHHHYCYELKYIDDYSLNSILKLFNKYKQEGGNSFIETFVEEIKALPKQQIDANASI